MSALAPGAPKTPVEPKPAASVLLVRDAPAGAGEPPLVYMYRRIRDLRLLRYLSHFTTPTSSPIRFAARFFLGPTPRGQEPRLFTEETSEGFWIAPGEGYRRFLAGDMKMAEPAEYGLAYLSQFASLADLLAAHYDRRHKFQGIADRLDVMWSSFDWKQNRFPGLTS